MRLVSDDLRREIERQRPLCVRVRADGFEIDGQLTPTLTGRITEARLTRKLFADRQFQCQSPDGITGTDQRQCASCRHRTAQCQALLRISIVLTDGRRCTLDLASSSARNLMKLDDELARTDIPIPARNLILSVVSRERWGEVRFAVDSHDD